MAAAVFLITSGKPDGSKLRAHSAMSSGLARITPPAMRKVKIDKTNAPSGIRVASQWSASATAQQIENHDVFESCSVFSPPRHRGMDVIPLTIAVRHLTSPFILYLDSGKYSKLFGKIYSTLQTVLTILVHWQSSDLTLVKYKDHPDCKYRSSSRTTDRNLTVAVKTDTISAAIKWPTKFEDGLIIGSSVPKQNNCC
ncbi:hypothetical protein R3P38DRAFT_2762998 [Favolaschia claudopus]|uniref:Uncharacterized protein n=1 Tax=Favolaschia claudopus TaxID=2862362 RepID=A0AAW0DN79_9AGAR